MTRFKIFDNLVLLTASSNFSLSRKGIYNILTDEICKMVNIPETQDLVVLSIDLSPSVSTKNNSSLNISLLISWISILFLSTISFILTGP